MSASRRKPYLLLFALLAAAMPAKAAVDPGPPETPVLSAGFLAAPPVLDGVVRDEEWAGAAGTNAFRRLADDALLPDAPVVRAGFDDRGLYLAAVVPLPAGARPKAVAGEHDGPVWQDDALEVFLDPRHDHHASYQFLVNAAGTRAELLDQKPGWNGEWRAKASVQDGAWHAEMAIPWQSLGLQAPQGDTVLGLNLGWDRQTPAGLTGTWAPLTGSFHQPGAFGHLLLRRGGPALSVARVAEPGAIAFALAPGGGKPVEATLRVTRDGKAVGSETVSLVKPGRLAVRLPVKDGRPEDGAYRCELVATDGGTPVARLTGTVRVAPPLALTLRRYFLSGKLVVEADAAAAGAKPAAFEARLVSADGKECARQRTESPAGARASFTFDVAHLPAGAYRARAEARDAAGASLASAEQAFTRPPKPDWLGSRAGISDAVLPPWTPLRVSRATGDRRPGQKPGHPLTVSCWGRAYTFDGGPFPTGVVTRGASILAAPIRLRLRADGQDVALKGALKVTKQTPGQVVLSGTATGGALRVTSTVTIDFDGNARADFRVQATRPTQIEALTVEAPIRKANARYLYHFPGSWGSSRNCGTLPEKGWQHAFKPYVWLGDEDRGFALYTESDEHWHPADPKRAVEVAPEGETAVLRFNVIGRPVRLDTGAGLPYTFGFVATPVKQPEGDVWDYRICHYGGYGLEKQTVSVPCQVTYPGSILNPEQGTLEMWVRVRFDPNAPVTDHGSRGSMNRDLLTISGGQDSFGFYWNIDDRGMRAYVKRGESYPFVVGAKSEWREGEWHHLALSWGTEVRAYVDGKLTVKRPWKGLVAAPTDQISVEFGGRTPGFEVDEIRVSGVQREPEVSGEPYAADAHTLLLDPLDAVKSAGRLTTTAPTKGAPGVVTGKATLVEGKAGKALALAAGKPVPMLEYLKSLGVRTVVFHEHWTEYQNYPETFLHQEALKSLVQACHAHGLKLLLYFGYLMADTCPEWDLYSDEVLALPIQGEYHREPKQKCYTCCYASAWQDFIADGIAKLMDKYDVDGVYLDGTEYPWACNNLAHGCGYVRPDGSAAPTTGIFAAREMMRRIYAIVKSRKPDGQVNVHNSTCMTIPTLGWATSSWDGEQFGSIARGVDVEELLPLDAFRCEFMGRQWGVPAEFLCYNRPYTQHEALSFTLLHDVLVRGSGPGLVEEADLWKAMERFGRKQATWLPYWSNGNVARVTPAGCYASLYSRPGIGVICVVSNLGKAPAEVKVALDAAKLKLPKGARAVDAVTGAPVAFDAGTLSLRLDPFDYALVQIGGPAAPR